MQLKKKFAVHSADQNCVCYTAKGARFTVWKGERGALAQGWAKAWEIDTYANLYCSYIG